MSGAQCLESWQQAISSAFYRQEATSELGHGFAGTLSVISIGPLSLSHIRSASITYRRRRAHISAQSERHHLVTIPLRGDLFFDQNGTRTRCPAGGLLAERSDLPYELLQPEANELIVLKVPEATLAMHLPVDVGFVGGAIGQSATVAALFTEAAQSLLTCGELIGSHDHPRLCRHLLDLLALALTDDVGSWESQESAVRAAQMRRIKRAIRRCIFEPGLSPADISAACGISVRYLHALFAATGTTVSRWVLEERLRASHDALRDPSRGERIGDLAQQFGFADQPHFSRHYKRRFGETPGQTRAAALERRKAAMAILPPAPGQ